MSTFQRQPQLLEAFRQGERWALARVFRDHVRMLDRYLRALAQASHAPELEQPGALVDLLQEVFVRALSPEARLAYDGDLPYGPYLRKLAKELFAERLPAHCRSADASLDVVLGNDSGAPSHGEKLADPRVDMVLTAYLAGLPPPLRGVYEQRYVLGNSRDDSCAALGITHRRLRADEARLTSGLRRALVEKGIVSCDLSEVGLAGTMSTHVVR
jgi:DNA-directed RNA polymerase specialized sigma24 family protein